MFKASVGFGRKTFLFTKVTRCAIIQREALKDMIYIYRTTCDPSKTNTNERVDMVLFVHKKESGFSIVESVCLNQKPKMLIGLTRGWM